MWVGVYIMVYDNIILSGLTLTFYSTRTVGLLSIIFSRPDLTSANPDIAFQNERE
jgi:hypothetical protein